MNNNEAITLLQDAADRADAFLEMAQLAATDARAIARLLKQQEAELLQQEAELDILRNIYKQDSPSKQEVKWE